MTQPTWEKWKQSHTKLRMFTVAIYINSQTTGMIHVSMNWWMEKQNGVHLYKGANQWYMLQCRMNRKTGCWVKDTSHKDRRMYDSILMKCPKTVSIQNTDEWVPRGERRIYYKCARGKFSYYVFLKTCSILCLIWCLAQFFSETLSAKWATEWGGEWMIEWMNTNFPEASLVTWTRSTHFSHSCQPQQVTYISYITMNCVTCVCVRLSSSLGISLNYMKQPFL